MEKTLTIIKPDAMRANVGIQIIDILKNANLKMLASKKVILTLPQVEEFYQEHKGKPFFSAMTRFMCNSPVLVICWEGKNAISLQRELIGATNPQEAKKGTIRQLFGKNIDNNAIHGSDSPQAAEREIKFFFSK